MAQAISRSLCREHCDDWGSFTSRIILWVFNMWKTPKKGPGHLPPFLPSALSLSFPSSLPSFPPILPSVPVFYSVLQYKQELWVFVCRAQVCPVSLGLVWLTPHGPWRQTRDEIWWLSWNVETSRKPYRGSFILIPQASASHGFQ